MKKIFIPTNDSAVNQQLVVLEDVKSKIAELEREAQKVIEEIRSGFGDLVVVFIDMVGSTEYKLDYSQEPEKWILRQKQFGEVITEYIKELGGRIVKYIGDEVMAAFDRNTRINDSVNLILRINEIESNLKLLLDAETRIKICIDAGDVYLLKYEGHDELDPQGTPIDRCARIAKFAEPGAVLASFDYVKQTQNLLWQELGSVELKGIGETTIYQLGEKTVRLKKYISVEDSKYKALEENMKSVSKDLEKLTLENNRLISMNDNLQNQLLEAGKTPATEDSVQYIEEASSKQEEEWSKIRLEIAKLKKIIRDANAPSNEYARFLFLYMRGDRDQYNKFEDKTFDKSIESNLVEEDDEGYYSLDTSHKRNKLAISVMNNIEEMINCYSTFRMT